MSSSDGESRRAFLQQLGIGVAGLGVAGAWTRSERSELRHHAQAGDPCAPPAHGAARAFVRDCRPIRPRQVANRMTPAEVTQLKAAYKAMRDLDTSDPNDPRGFTRQANIHCFHCGDLPANEMHFSWSFFAWHRAYLYFHERILGRLIGDENFRLPYWGWDTAGFRALPTPYVTPNDSTNPLFNSTRTLTPGTLLPAAEINDSVISDTLGLANAADFLGSATDSGIPEGSPHGSPHVRTGGDMRFFATAAKDPVFYAHHGTMDKLWSDWNKSSSAHTNPTAAAFNDLTFTFFDENKQWRSIKASQVVDHEHSLRYVYEPSRIWTNLFCLIWRPISINWAATQRISIAGNNVLGAAVRSANTPLRLQIRGLRVPTDRSTVYGIYADQAEAQADRGPGSPAFLGTIAVVLNDPRNRRPTRGTRNVELSLPPGVRSSLGRGGSLPLFLVDRDDRSRVVPVRAANVIVTRGEPDTER